MLLRAAGTGDTRRDICGQCLYLPILATNGVLGIGQLKTLKLLLFDARSVNSKISLIHTDLACIMEHGWVRRGEHHR